LKDRPDDLKRPEKAGKILSPFQLIVGRVRQRIWNVVVNEAELIENCIRGDSQAIETLMQTYKSYVYSFLNRMLRDQEDVSDLFQEVWRTVFQKLASFKGQSKFSTWLVTITKNTCYDHLRKKRVALDYIDGENIEIPTSGGFEKAEDGFETLLGMLPEKYRALLILRYLYDFPYEEIARIMRVDLRKVKSRLYEAKQALKRSLDKEKAAAS
jgi:RNA polymerase sigma-70 factor, ECF subfamily